VSRDSECRCTLHPSRLQLETGNKNHQCGEKRFITEYTFYRPVEAWIFVIDSQLADGSQRFLLEQMALFRKLDTEKKRTNPLFFFSTHVCIRDS